MNRERSWEVTGVSWVWLRLGGGGGGAPGRAFVPRACKSATRELDGKPGIRAMSWAQRRESGSRQTEERKVTLSENSEVISDLEERFQWRAGDRA